MSGKPAQTKKTEGTVQATAERLVENVERLAAALTDDTMRYDEAIAQGYAPISEVAESLGISIECARGRLRRAKLEVAKSRVPGKRLPEQFYRVQTIKE